MTAFANDRDRPGEALIRRRHGEHAEFSVRWRWLLDSYEGGERYRHAVYGVDTRGQLLRNLVRHKREYPDPRESTAALSYGAGTGGGQGGLAETDGTLPGTDDDYELRRTRTPVPTIFGEAVDKHLARIYGREVERDGPTILKSWWNDVDGRGTEIDDWMKDVVGPMVLVLGQLDLVFDHPPAPTDAVIRTKADSDAKGLGRCVASYILPENMQWWRLDPAGRYAECVVKEHPDPVEEAVAKAESRRPKAEANKQVLPCRYRHWTATDWTLYSDDGKVIDSGAHSFGCVPIVRVFARRKLRTTHVGQPPMEAIAELQREYYNRDSELILSDTLQAHPLLQGPEDFVQEDGTIPIGPSWLLPKKKNTQGGASTYEGFDVVNFPKEGAESIRLNKADIRDQCDRASSTNKPAGASSNGTGVVSQSGISKNFDDRDRNDQLCRESRWLAQAERIAAEYALIVLTDGRASDADIAAIDVSYSEQFDLSGVQDLGEMLTSIQTVVAGGSQLPFATATIAGQMFRQSLPGRDPSDYEAFDAEAEAALAAPPEPAPIAANPQIANAPGASDSQGGSGSLVTLPPAGNVPVPAPA